MYIRFVDERPEDFSDYISLPANMNEMAIEQRLVAMLAEGTSNLHIPECCLASVLQQQVFDAARKNGYQISARPLFKKSATAEFFFQRLPQ